MAGRPLTGPREFLLGLAFMSGARIAIGDRILRKAGY